MKRLADRPAAAGRPRDRLHQSQSHRSSGKRPENRKKVSRPSILFRQDGKDGKPEKFRRRKRQPCLHGKPRRTSRPAPARAGLLLTSNSPVRRKRKGDPSSVAHLLPQADTPGRFHRLAVQRRLADCPRRIPDNRRRPAGIRFMTGIVAILFRITPVPNNGKNGGRPGL